MEANKTAIKEKIIEVMNELPAEKMIEILDFAAFVRQNFQHRNIARNLTTPKIEEIPAARLRLLTGIIAWGGDALIESERLYE